MAAKRFPGLETIGGAPSPKAAAMADAPGQSMDDLLASERWGRSQNVDGLPVQTRPQRGFSIMASELAALGACDDREFDRWQREQARMAASDGAEERKRIAVRIQVGRLVHEGKIPTFQVGQIAVDPAGEIRYRTAEGEIRKAQGASIEWGLEVKRREATPKAALEAASRREARADADRRPSVRLEPGAEASGD